MAESASGGSTINYMMYVRDNKLDYDSWEKHGATGWNWDNVKRYFKRVENYFLNGGEISI